MSFPRYEVYRENGVEWLGELPAHWSVKRLKRVSRISPSNVDKKHVEGEEHIRLCNYTDVYYNDLITSDMNFMSATATPGQIEKFSLKAGQTIITKDSETADDIAIAAYVPQDIPGVVCGYHLAVLTPKDNTYGPFLKRFFDSSFAKACFEIRANGLTRVGLSQYAIDNIEIPFPPKSEQILICSFLDRETAKIDALVQEQQRLIKLLNEKRQAVISHAVTKSLNPDAPMKDSGVEWIGEVPEHWEVKQVGRLCDYISYGFTNPMPTADEGPFMLTANDIDYGSIRYDTARRTTDAAFSELLTNKSRPEAGDLLLTKDGTLGRIAIHDGQQACINQSVALLRPNANIVTSEFLWSALMGGVYQDRMIYEAGGTTIRHIYISRLAKMPLAVPPVPEQSAIYNDLSQRLGQQDALIAEAEAAIVLLQERRSALISAAVTGKIDVRGLVSVEAEAA